MRLAHTLALLCISSGIVFAQDVPRATPFSTSVETLRSSVLKLASPHTLTAADGKTFSFNVSYLDLSADAATCNLTWKDKVDLTVAQQVHTITVNLEDIASLNSLSSLNTKMGVEPFIQILQVHMRPNTTAIVVTDRFDGAGKPLGTPETRRIPVTSLYTASEAEATLIIRQLTAVMSKCTVPRQP